VEIPHDDRLMLNRLIGHYNYQNTLVNELTDNIKKLSQTERYKEQCMILCCFRGIQTITAMTLLTHIADFRAIPHSSKLMSYIGLTSKEYSSGEKLIITGITKQGSSILRNALIFAAQQYNRAERTGIHMLMKRKGLSLPEITLVQKADRRLKNKYFRLLHKGKNFFIKDTTEESFHTEKILFNSVCLKLKKLKKANPNLTISSKHITLL